MFYQDNCQDNKDFRTEMLGDICEIVTGTTPPRSNKQFYGGLIPWIKPDDLDKSMYVSSSSEFLTEEGVNSARLLPKGSVLFSCIGNLGKLAIARVELTTNQQINALIPSQELDSEYLFFACMKIKPLLNNIAAKTVVPIINKSRLSAISIPVPSIYKQRQIASRLKAQLAEVETARKALELQQQEIVNLANAYIRESIEQSPVIQTRGGLISAKTVGAGRARDLSHTETYSRAWPAPTHNPMSVTETRLGDVLDEIKQGIGETWADYPVLGATRSGLAPAKEPPGKQPQRYKPVFCGTVFYNPMRILIGSIAFVDDDDEPGITSPDYVALQGKAGLVDSRWFYYWLRSPYGEQCINSLARGAVRERMLFNRLAEGLILLPSYQEQLRVSKALATLKPVKSAIQEQFNELNKIPERLLAQAFELK